MHDGIALKWSDRPRGTQMANTIDSQFRAIAIGDTKLPRDIGEHRERNVLGDVGSGQFPRPSLWKWPVCDDLVLDSPTIPPRLGLTIDRSLNSHGQ